MMPKPQIIFSFLGTALLLPFLFSAGSYPDLPAASKKNRYIGAAACKNCHKAKEQGETFQIWEGGPHAKAWKTLASEEAKKLGAEHGVDAPQKSPKCLKCHVTGYGEKKRKFKRSFKKQMGVQCESCHGPGERHFKKRFALASAGKADVSKFVQIPEDEIILKPDLKTCQRCHNEDSPTFKPFCFQQRRAKILHMDPRKKRTKKEVEALKAACGDDCKICAKAKSDAVKDTAAKNDAAKNDAAKKEGK